MKTLKAICLNLIHKSKQLGALPQTISSALELRRRQLLLSESEIERLDRIRNPSKYLGK